MLFSRRWLLKALTALPFIPKITSSVDLSRLRAVANHVMNAPDKYIWQLRFEPFIRWGHSRVKFDPTFPGFTPYRWAREFGL